jgi:hypothetical protein
MVPPGDSLEFFESQHFKRTAQPSPELRESVIEHLRSWPQSGIEVAKGVRELLFEFHGCQLAVLYRRQGNRMGLMQMFRLPEQQALLDEIKLKSVGLYGPVQSGGKR